MSDWETIDFFTDESLVEDPYPYFDDLRAAGPVLPLPHLGVVAVTGYDEVSEVYHDPETFSSCNSVVGPYAMFPVPLEGDDVRGIVAEHRDQLPMHEHMVTMDPPDHSNERALLMRLITPKRLKDNEAFMWRLADQQLDEFVTRGDCEFITAYTQPFAMLAVADLLGVPEADHQKFRLLLLTGVMLGTIGRPRLVRRRWLCLPIGTFCALVLSGAWTDTAVLWWPTLGWTFPPGNLLPVTWVVLIEEVAGLAACWWIVGLCDLYLPGPRREFLSTGRLHATTEEPER